jgi:hypothetical protein
MGVEGEIQAIQLEVVIQKRTQFLYPEDGSHNFSKILVTVYRSTSYHCCYCCEYQKFHVIISY